MTGENRYLLLRGTHWQYQRRVPSHFAAHDARGLVRHSLKTTSLEIARKRRDELEAVDDLYWSSLVRGEGDGGDFLHYQAAVKRAVTLNLHYRAAGDLADSGSLDHLLMRADVLKRLGLDHQLDVEAVLGGVERPKISLQAAFDLYMDKICGDDIAGKSIKQKHRWSLPKQRAVSSFIKCVGDVALEDITRAHALKFFEWWQGRIYPKDDAITPMSASSGKRDIGNLRKCLTSTPMGQISGIA